MTRHNMIDPDGRVRINSKMCDTCIFGAHSPVDKERSSGMLEECNQTSGAIPCHHTLDDKFQNVCAGFAVRTSSGPIQIAQRLGLVNKYEPSCWRDGDDG
jgi:hypothetical protein